MGRFEDERYQKYYNRPPHGEIPQDPKRREALEAGAPEPDEVDYDPNVEAPRDDS
ncbi:hypothetical protein GCM10022377_18970 [Zhihengliuella alba]|uniref:Uncharacterized protein n=1 Tax=Zhihengliuella alba TaxID=547018 RepID=A0ABP7DMM2_9MICC